MNPLGLFLDPPGPLLTHLHTVCMAYSECLPTRLNPLAERTCFSQVPVPLRGAARPALDLRPEQPRPRAAEGHAALDPLPAGRVRSHCRFRKRCTEYISESGIKWMSGCTKRQCDRTLHTCRVTQTRRIPKIWNSENNFTCRGAWTRVTIGQFRCLALRTL